MSNLVEQLRALYATHPVIAEAADEIELLLAVITTQAAEIEQLRNARDLLIKAMMRSTGADEAAIREAPLTEAMKHVAEIAARQQELERLREHVRQLAATLSEQDTAIAALDAANAAQRSEIARLNAHINKQDADPPRRPQDERRRD